MGKIYKNQALKYIKLNTKIDLQSADSLSIVYKKPNAATGEWTGSLEGTTVIKVVVDNNILDVSGTWKIQAKAVIDNQTFLGETVEFKINELFT